MTKSFPLEINVWFLFGSFTYGLEAHILAPPHLGSLIVDFWPERSAPELEKVSEFIELMIDEAPKGLVSFHVDFYEPEGTETWMRLSTSVVPRLVGTEKSVFREPSGASTEAWLRGNGELSQRDTPRLRVEGMQGLTPEDEKLWEAWQNLFL